MNSSFLTMVAAISPEEELIDQLSKAIEKYKTERIVNNISEKTRNEVAFYCMLFMSKITTGDSLEKAMEISKQKEDISKMMQSLNTKLS